MCAQEQGTRSMKRKRAFGAVDAVLTVLAVDAGLAVLAIDAVLTSHGTGTRSALVIYSYSDSYSPPSYCYYSY